jgi:AraC family transcriptional regulator
MPQRHEPVTMGSQRSRVAHTDCFCITDAWFPAGSVLGDHTHDRSIIAVMIAGSFETAIAARRIECLPATMWTEPRAERHANYIGTRGARVLVTQPNPDRHDLLEPFARLLDDVLHVHDPALAIGARRIAAEIAIADSLSALSIDALVMLNLTRAARLQRSGRSDRRPPRWLLRSRELLHARFRERLDLTSLAEELGVTPWHLAREFRRHFHASPGEYARARRLEWALGELSRGSRRIAEIAQAAGYTDQSHLTRTCKATTGLAPAAYRRRERA